MNKIRIGILTTGKSLIEMTRQFAVKKNIDLQCIEEGLDDAIPFAKEMESNGAEVLLARGGTALLIRKNVQIPVLSFPISTIDILSCLKEATAYGSNILIVSFLNRKIGLEFVEELFDVRITQEVCRNFIEMQELISTHGEKYDAIIGGSTSLMIARQYGLNFIETHTPEEAVETTLESAISVALHSRSEQEKTKRFSLILNGVSDGVIAYDREGRITLLNDQANKLLKRRSTSFEGTYLQDLISQPAAIRAISTSQPKQDKIEKVGSDHFVFNHTPIVVNDSAVGGVTTFKDVSNVIQVEGEIRRSFARGLVAKYGLSDLVYESNIMEEMVNRSRRFASTDSTILIIGETGTGKEILAHSIHGLSNRNSNALVSINCAALSEELLQSELFGYEEGAFTGSRKGGKPGLFEIAHNGTIFLDEINATSQNVQRHLLRVLQEREVMRIGADRVTPINVRVLAASNSNLIEEVNRGRFREDLFFRLNVLTLTIPPLRDRLSDIPLLVNRFMQLLTIEYEQEQFFIPEQYMHKLKQYQWPGNVRQLRNFIERLVLICDSGFDYSVFDELYFELFEYRSNKIYSQGKRGLQPALETQSLPSITGDSEYAKIKSALETSGYSRSKAAKLLGISRTTLWKKLKKFEQN
ncbi:MAG: sigma 54-interacting transcriptional regulator [Desulfobacterales bacterium]|nr:sigma 54-interacting transcriptional regulator [Desulfobacterales bacterium]